MTKTINEKEILDLYRGSGVPLREIAEKFGVSMTYITLLGQENGLSRREPYTTRTAELDDMIINDLSNGLKISDVCNKYDVSRTFVYNTEGVHVARARFKEKKKTKAHVIGTLSSKKRTIEDILESVQEVAQELHDAGFTFKDVVEVLDSVTASTPTTEDEPKDVGTVNLYNPIIL